MIKKFKEHNQYQLIQCRFVMKSVTLPMNFENIILSKVLSLIDQFVKRSISIT